MPTLARQINEEMVKHATNLTYEALRAGGGTLRRAKIAVLGAESKDGVTFVGLLEGKGAKITRYHANSNEFVGNLSDGDHSDSAKAKKTLNEAVEGTDCVVLFSAEEQLKRLNLKKLRALMKSPASFVDLAGVMEPQKVEAEGFIYRGLGRGVHKK
jgi:UDPglucose 6-dehydrogenase